MIVCSNIQTGGELTSEKPLENDERIEFHNVGLFSDLNLETPTNRILSNLKKTNIFQLDQESEIRDVSP
jgi:hypothetical protein